MKRGVILEVNNQYVTLLTPEGEFLRTRKVKEHYEIGEEIDFFPVNEYVTEKKSFFRLNKVRAGIATTMAAALIFFTVFSFYDGNEVYAYMTIDMNPSIEAGVDKKLRVVSLEGYNTEGEQVVNSLEEWLNEPIDSVTEAIIEESKNAGYYEEGAEVLLTTVIVEDENATEAEKLNENIQAIVERSKEENIPVTAIKSTNEDREVAVKKGITTGKYVKESLMVQEKEAEKKKNIENKATEKKEQKGHDNGAGKGPDDNGPNNNQNEQTTPGNGHNNGLFEEKGITNPAAVEKEKDKLNIDLNDNRNLEMDLNNWNKGKGHQEDKKGPPEAVGKEKHNNHPNKQNNKHSNNNNNKHHQKE